MDLIDLVNYLIIVNDPTQVESQTISLKLLTFLLIPDGGAHSSAYSGFLASDPYLYSWLWFPLLGNFVHNAVSVFHGPLYYLKAGYTFSSAQLFLNYVQSQT